MKILRSLALAIIAIVVTSSATSCKKNQNEADGTYYNERTGETGSNDTAAVTNRTKIEVVPDSTGVMSEE